MEWYVGTNDLEKYSPDEVYRPDNSGGGGGGDSGSSDFSTAEVTVIVNDNTAILYMAHVYDDTEVEVAIFESGTYNVVLYKGCALGSVIASGPSQITVSGDIEVDSADVFITGNGTITIS